MRQWAISIGINQYQFFQPLSYAQHDAQAIQSFLVGDVGIPAEQCLLLTETSPTHWGKSTYPDRETIQSWLDRLTQQYLEPEDLLWFFFSGYGLCQQGQDYLVPIDGNPAAIQPTAIPLETVFRSLRRVPTATALVLLDMNRNESSSYETVGNHTTHLASITGIPTILSCQPGQFSRETSALGHGFFTATLLEGLRSRQCSTIAALDQYLSTHLPILSEHYWRPVQQAVTVCPDEKRQQPLIGLLSGFTTNQTGHDRHLATHTTAQNGIALATSTALSTVVKAPSDADNYRPLGDFANGNGKPTSTIAPTALPTPNGQAVSTNSRASAASGSTEASANHSPYAIANGATNGSVHSANGLASMHSHANGAGAYSARLGHPIDSAAQNHENGVAQSAQASTVTQPHSDSPEEGTEIPDALFWRPVLLWGSLVVVGLILGVLLRNCASFSPKSPSTAQQPATTGTRQSGAVKSGTEQPGTEQPGTGQPGTGQPGTGQPGTGQPVSTGLPAVKTAAPVTPSTPATVKPLSPQPIASAQGFGVSGASRLNLSTGSSSAPTQPNQPTQSAIPVSLPVQSPLAKARALVAINSNQASPYWYAIRGARAVQPGQPDYVQAQQEIASWSRKILSIARQRSRQGSYDAAIVAARLVPQDQLSYTEVKGALASWCPALDRQRVANPVQRQQAKNTCRSFS